MADSEAMETANAPKADDGDANSQQELVPKVDTFTVPKYEDIPHAMEVENDLAPRTDAPKAVGSSSNPRKIFNVKRLRLLSFICNTVFLAVAVAYVAWWPDEMNLDRLALRAGSVVETETGPPTFAPTAGDEADRVATHIQTWQISYLCVAVLMSYYGAFVTARGPLLISMIANVGLMALFQWWSFMRGWPFAMFCTFLAMANACACYLLSERVQEEHELKGVEENPRSILAPLLGRICGPSWANWRISPELDIYHFGQMQMLVSCAVIAIGLMSWLTHETMIEPKISTQRCKGWPNEECKVYYGTEIETSMVLRLAAQMGVAGVFGILGTYFRHRTALILAFTLTIPPFTGAVQASYQVLFTRENVNYMCDFFPGQIPTIWGDNFDCDKEKHLQNINVLLLALSSVATGIHFFTTIRFSEKLQSWADANRYEIDTNLGDQFHLGPCITVTNPARLYTLCMIFGALIQFASGVAQIVFTVQAKNDETLGKLQGSGRDILEVVTLDDPWYREAPAIYAAWALISAVCMGIHPWVHSRTMLSITTVILIEALVIGINLEVWHYNDLDYGIDSTVPSHIGKYPIYVGDDARDIAQSSANQLTICNIFNALSIFFTILASESIQDARRMLNQPVEEDGDGPVFSG